ncbi:UDP-N-acetylmuramoyl-tripeptide--D-alanyl-D-alanine ligase [Psychromonas marina]|uniref:UDP-N-acetylmuramoyl-tripeptide--D-alanyl-D-alanine ligase n=1 Tax=Psychromonas marina TaxID=88364 RepID=A0ABQ6DXW3_9GAMM|nr:UDP-N-acetylmuramoyl-tripeptide--D-alanyl-D-alanine ligase [Psychromonas marina]GLS89829.1 UDP-N-acetylmuramoyl-tripeptide--D-alanyl-D-alanine ligase [Psychromonas marina]
MIPLTLAEIATATAGKLLNSNESQLSINSVCTDTRNIEAGCLFIALQGESFDAHNFLTNAQQAGASALLVHQKTSSELPTILVKDTRIALGLLSAYVKTKIENLKCAAITGSNGKTTTKEMLAAILGVFSQSENSVLATAGNFNNDIGLPLTLLRLTEHHRYAVVELGANHQGEIAYTANLAKPDVALINNVMPAHLEGFGSIEGVANAKSEIWSSLTKCGTGVVNLDAKFSETFIKQLNAQQSQLFTFSQTDTDATVYASDVTYDPLGNAIFTLNYEHSKEQVCLNIAGKHNVSNALAATSMALVLGCDLHHIRQGLANLKQVAGRVNSTQVNDNLLLIDDSYNANSASLKAAIDLLMQCSGEKLLIVADMGELGQYAEQEHRSVGEYAAEKGVNLLLTVGQLTQFTHQSFSSLSDQSSVHFADKAGLKAYLTPYLQKSSNKNLTILVKGSRSAKMEEIVAFIKQPQIG